MKSHILLFILVARNICGASEMARKYRLHLFQFCSSVIATIFYCLAVAFFASPGLYFFIIIAQKFFIFSAMFYYSFAIVCLLLSKLFSKKTQQRYEKNKNKRRIEIFFNILISNFINISRRKEQKSSNCAARKGQKSFFHASA